MDDYEDRFNEFMKTTIEMFGMQYKPEYAHKDFNTLYGNYKIFTQNSTYQSCFIWFFCLYLSNFAVDVSSEKSIKNIFNHYLMSPILIAFFILTKKHLTRSVEPTTLYYLQNSIIFILGLCIPKSDQIQISILCELIVYVKSMECYGFKIVFALIQVVQLQDHNELLQILNSIIILLVITYQELQLYTSYIVDYNQVKTNQASQLYFVNIIRFIIKQILSSQNRQQKSHFISNLNKQIIDFEEKKQSKWSFENLFEYFL